MAVAVWNRQAGCGCCLKLCGQIVEIVQAVIPKQILHTERVRESQSQRESESERVRVRVRVRVREREREREREMDGWIHRYIGTYIHTNGTCMHTYINKQINISIAREHIL